MASRISQMRNGMQPTMHQPSPQQQGLNQSIEQVRGLMQQVKNAQNPQAMLAQLLQNNPNVPAIANMLRNNGSLESIARQMAQAQNIDINQLINQLQGGL